MALGMAAATLSEFGATFIRVTLKGLKPGLDRRAGAGGTEEAPQPTRKRSETKI